VIALVTRWTNRNTAKMHTPGPGGIAVWVQPGGAREKVVAHWLNKEERRYRIRGGFAMDARSDGWSAVENPATGDSLLVVATDPHGHTDVEDFGDEGPHLMVSGDLQFEPNETREILGWLVHMHDLSQADAYGALSKVRILP